MPARHQQPQFLPSPWLCMAVVLNKCYFSGLMRIAADPGGAHKPSSDGTWPRRTENAVSFYGPAGQSPGSCSG